MINYKLYHDAANSFKQGNNETMKQGNNETRKQGNKETRKQGNNETRKQGMQILAHACEPV